MDTVAYVNPFDENATPVLFQAFTQTLDYFLDDEFIRDDDLIIRTLDGSAGRVLDAVTERQDFNPIELIIEIYFYTKDNATLFNGINETGVLSWCDLAARLAAPLVVACIRRYTELDTLDAERIDRALRL